MHGSGEVNSAFTVAGVDPSGFDFAFAGHGSAAGEFGGHTARVLLDVADLAACARRGFGSVVLVDFFPGEADLCGVRRA